MLGAALALGAAACGGPSDAVVKKHCDNVAKTTERSLKLTADAPGLWPERDSIRQEVTSTHNSCLRAFGVKPAGHEE